MLLHSAVMFALGWDCDDHCRSWLDKGKRVRSRDVSTQTAEEVKPSWGSSGVELKQECIRRRVHQGQIKKDMLKYFVRIW